MDFYTFLKFLHVALAVAWVGGTFSGGVFGRWVWRHGTVDDMVGVIKWTTFSAKAVFGPATLGVLALGVWMTWLNFDFAEAWIDIALTAIAVHVAVGYGVVMPRFKALDAALRDGRMAESDRAQFGWVMRMGLAHEVMLFAVLLDMVAKPQWSDIGLIGAIVVIAVLGFAQMAMPMRVARVH